MEDGSLRHSYSGRVITQTTAQEGIDLMAQMMEQGEDPVACLQNCFSSEQLAPILETLTTEETHL